MAPKKGKVGAKKVEEAPAAAAPAAAAPAAATPEKRKAEEKAEEPPTKEAKVEEVVEKETDARSIKGAAVGEIGFNTTDLTLNVIPTMGGKVLAALTEGGMQYFVAGARSNVGMKSGRYMFEVKILELLAGWNPKGNAAARQVLRVGFSTASAPLVLGTSEEQVFFDGEGGFYVGSTKGTHSKRFFRDNIIQVLLNLDSKSPNSNTVSLFVDGVRAMQPQALPEGLVGKPLFPHISFRGVKVLTHFGPVASKELPFKCHMLGAASEADCAKAKQVEPKDGKYEVLMPVGFPDEGTFEWLDGFLEKHPQYTELSDRKILEWAASSGLWSGKGWKSSNDKPEFKFGAPGMDDGSIQKIINSVAGIMPRNYVVMEVKSNLVGADRQETLKRFSLPHFKKVAAVIMGTPPAEFKKVQQERILKDKQVKAETAWKMAKMEKKRAKDKVKQQKAFEERKKKMEEEAKKKAAEAEAKKAAEAEAKKKAAAEKKEGDKEEEKKGDEKKEEETKEEKKEEEKKEEEKKDEPMEEESEEETEPPKVELTDEEKKLCFAPKRVSDLSAKEMSKYFASFSIPEKAEGFAEIKFEWQKDAAAKEYLRQKVLEKKRTCRIEDLAPSQWFNETLKAFEEKLKEWQAKQVAFKGSEAGKASAAKKAEKKEGEEEEAKEEGDIDSVEDVADVGGGVPLFKDFGFEDWALLQLRYELFLLQAAYKKDVDDSDRPGITDAHLGFYYNRYYRKNFSPKSYGVDTNQDLAKLVKDSIAWEADVLTSPLTCEPTDTSFFVKATETHRRERQRRVDAGDETARLKIAPDAMKKAGSGGSGGKGGGGNKGGGKGWKKW